jgi:hypothetical protein
MKISLKLFIQNRTSMQIAIIVHLKQAEILIL